MLLRPKVLLLLLESVFASVSCWTYLEELDFRKEYLKNYNKAIRPLKNMDGLVSIDAVIKLVHIRDFNLVDGYIKVDAYLLLRWYDEILHWNDSYSDITNLSVSSNEIWAPRLGLYNIRGASSSNFIPQLLLWKDGGVEKWMYISNQIICDIDAYAYPFDEHTCQLDIYFDDYAIDKVKFQNLSCDSEEAIDESNWDITVVCSFNCQNNYSHGYLRLKLVRKVKVKTFSDLLPLFIFFLLNIMVAKLSVESGEKVTFATTVFLSNVVYMGNISKQLPKEHNPVPLFFLCHLILTFLSGISTVGSIISSTRYWANKKSSKTSTITNPNDRIIEFKMDKPDMKSTLLTGRFKRLNFESVMFNSMALISVLYAATFTGLFSEYIFGKK